MHSSLLQRNFVRGVLLRCQIDSGARLKAIAYSPHHELILALQQIFHAIAAVFVRQHIDGDSGLDILSFDKRAFEGLAVGALHRAGDRRPMHKCSQRKNQTGKG